MQYNLQIYEYENESKLGVVEIDGAPWFVLREVCEAVGLKPHNRSYYHHALGLDDDEKRLVSRNELAESASSTLKVEHPRTALPPSLMLVNESGLYSLVLSSRKPEAKRFRKWVTSEVLPSIRRTGGFGHNRTPAFIRRFNLNWDRTAPGHFSVISELAIRLYGRFEQVGYTMADIAADGKELRPDISVGKLLSAWLNKRHPEVADQYSHYMHWTPAGEYEARQYPNSMLPLYIEFIDGVWLPEHSEIYFRKRDPKALAYLPKLLPGNRTAQLPPPRRSPAAAARY